MTGGTKGVGLTIAAGFVKNVRTYICSQGNQIEKLVEWLSNQGPGKAYSFVCDVMDEASILQVRDKIATLEPHVYTG